MPRKARIESKTGYYHIMTRGINKEKIFKTDREKEKILQFIDAKDKELESRIIAYCIMDNHLHMIVDTEKDELVSLMKGINISYAMYYNQTHDRIGPLFQGRFRSENILDEKYLFGAIRYVHNNPVKAQVVKRPEDYLWSSMHEYMSDNMTLINRNTKEDILNRFTSNKEFKIFHEKKDKNSYLEVIEESRKDKEKNANDLIEKYLDEKAIENLGQLHNKDELITTLLKEDITYRRISELLGTTISRVHSINKRNFH
ncbi:transposase [Alkalibacter mobilis]|uniref:transposase n=1 Tax=Alkalibacter mobilis TaxID=2787712 RepID=UPI00189F2105|nr:transposase [Alkalibacter mobilis]